MNKLVRLYNKIFMIFPLGIAGFLAFVCLVGGWGTLFDDMGKEHFFLMDFNNVFLAIVCLCLIALAILLITRFSFFIKDKISIEWLKKGWLLLGIFACAFFARFILVYVYREDWVPFSDFSSVWSIAHGGLEGNIEYYSLFPAYLNFSVFLNKFIHIFGDVFTNVLYLNCFLCGLTAMFLGAITWMVTKDEKTAFLAGLIYSFMPSNIFYVTLGTPEFITICFDTIGIFLLMTFAQLKSKWRYLFLVGAGVCLGVGSSFKSFATVIIIAFILVCFVRDFNNLKKIARRKFFFTIVCVIILLGTYKGTKTLILSNTEKFFNLELSESTAMPHYFLIGLNTEGEGQIHIGTLSRLYYTEYLNNGYDTEKAKEYAIELLKNDWKNNYKNLPQLFAKKIVWAWQADISGLSYFYDSEGIKINSLIESIIYNSAKNIFPALTQIFYLLLMIFAVIGSKIINAQKDINYKAVFTSLIIFGYACLMLLAESQSRYKCLILPYVCIFTSVGVHYFINKYGRFRRHK